MPAPGGPARPDDRARVHREASGSPGMIEVEGLRVVLPPSTVALDGVDLTIAAGQFVIVIGQIGRAHV